MGCSALNLQHTKIIAIAKNIPTQISAIVVADGLFPGEEN